MSAEDIYPPLRSNVVLDYDALSQLASALKGIGKKLVVTIGTYDAIHEGHMRYLHRAKSHGDVLIVGVDSDRAVKLYKGDHRPLVPEARRLECILHLGTTDFVTLIDDVDDSGNWGYELLRRIQPDVFVAVEDSYPKDQLDAIRQFCSEVVVLERQAETSTSEQIRQAAMTMNRGVPDFLRDLADKLEKGEPMIGLGGGS